MPCRIGEWLERLDLGKYEEVFVENDIDLDVLANLTAPDLRELGVSLGDRKRLRGAISDLNELPMANRLLANNEYRYRDLIENAIQGIIIHDEDARPILVNHTLAKMFGYDSPEEIMSLGTLRSLVADPASYAMMHGRRQKRLAGEAVEEVYEFEGRRRDGSTFWLLNQARAIDWIGQKAVQSTVIDISAQKRAEAALQESEALMRLMIDNLPVLIVYVDKDKRFRLVNKTCCEWYGLPEAEIIGKRVAEIHGDRYALFAPRIEKVLSGETHTFEDKVLYSDGRVRVIRSIHVPDFDVDGSVRGYFSLTEDITERQELEEKLRQSQKLESVGQLTSGIAHEFNNLLTAVIGNLGLLEDRLTDDDVAQRYVATAQRASEHGASLVKRLLAFSRRQALTPMRTDINEIVSNFRQLVRQVLGEDIEVVTRLADELWPVSVDRGQLESALLNLAINARDAMPNGGELLIEAGNRSLSEADAVQFDDLAPGDYTVVSLNDTGTGMSEETLRQAFDPFFTTKEVGEGTGLGLSIVFGFAKQSGGQVRLYSELGLGTTVRIYLPRATDEEPEHVISQHHENPRPETGAGTILVVEDDDAVREFIAEILQSLGYQVLTAEDGPSAQGLLKTSGPVDLLLTDVVLPGGMSGPELAKWFRQQQENGRVIFSSGYPHDLLDRQGKVPRDVTLLKKPYRATELASIVRRALSV